MSKFGFCSRSDAGKMIRAGQVRLNGEVCRNPEAPVRAGRDRIELDRRGLADQTKIYLMLNKPRGVVTTASDEKGRKTVYDCLDDALPWVAPVGRLDKASEGLLLLTNDSEWAARALAPQTHLDKTYHVQISAVADAALINSIARGVETGHDGVLRTKHVHILRRGNKNTWLEIVLDEGRNRQIRRIIEQFGIEVLRLLRVAIGPLTLGDLPKGAWRYLSEKERKALDQALDLEVR
jgi:23S rRNA pseudouridine2605 synthase